MCTTGIQLVVILCFQSAKTGRRARARQQEAEAAQETRESSSHKPNGEIPSPRDTEIAVESNNSVWIYQLMIWVSFFFYLKNFFFQVDHFCGKITHLRYYVLQW